MERLVGEEVRLECSGKGFELPSQGAREPLKVFEQG